MFRKLCVETSEWRKNGRWLGQANHLWSYNLWRDRNLHIIIIIIIIINSDKADLCGVGKLHGGRVVSSQAERSVKNLGMTIRWTFFLYFDNTTLNVYRWRWIISVLQHTQSPVILQPHIKVDEVPSHKHTHLHLWPKLSSVANLTLYVNNKWLKI